MAQNSGANVQRNKPVSVHNRVIDFGQMPIIQPYSAKKHQTKKLDHSGAGLQCRASSYHPETSKKSDSARNEDFSEMTSVPFFDLRIYNLLSSKYGFL